MRALLFFAGLLVGVGSVEVGLRFVLTEADASGHYFSRGIAEPDPDSLIRLKPHARGFVKRFAMEKIPLFADSFGMRIGASGPPAPAPTTILVFGASQGFGLGIPAEATFPARLEELLNMGRPARMFRVLNASMPGDKLPDYPLRLRRLEPAVRPGVLVFGIYLHRGIEHELVRTDGALEIVDGLLLDKARSFRGTLVDFLRTRSYLGMAVQARAGQMARVRSGPGGGWFKDLSLEEAAQVMEGGLKDLAGVARGLRIRMACVLLPEYRFDVPPLKDLHALARSRLDAHRIPTLDLGMDTPRGATIGQADVNYFDSHLNVSGSLKVAGLIADFLAERGLIPGS